MGLDDPVVGGGRPGAGSGGSGAGGALGSGAGGALGSGAGGALGSGGTLGSGGALGAGGTSTTGSSGGAFGTGGAGGGAPRCVPGRSEGCACLDGTPGAQVCGADGTFGPCACFPIEFQRIRDGMVGTWLGTERNPWTPAFRVEVTFQADGHYSTRCAQTSCPATVLYYGADGAGPERTYELRDVHASGTGQGIIRVVFNPGNVATGELDAVTLSPDAQHLAFEFWNTWSGRYGPVQFDLVRSQ